MKLSWSSKITRFGDFSPATPPPGFYEPKDAGRGRAKSTRGRRSARGRAGGPLAEDRDDDLPV